MEDKDFRKLGGGLASPVLVGDEHASHDCCAHHGHHHELEIDHVSVSYRERVRLDLMGK